MELYHDEPKAIDDLLRLLYTLGINSCQFWFKSHAGSPMYTTSMRHQLRLVERADKYDVDSLV